MVDDARRPEVKPFLAGIGNFVNDGLVRRLIERGGWGQKGEGGHGAKSIGGRVEHLKVDGVCGKPMGDSVQTGPFNIARCAFVMIGARGVVVFDGAARECVVIVAHHFVVRQDGQVGGVAAAEGIAGSSCDRKTASRRDIGLDPVFESRHAAFCQVRMGAKLLLL